MRLISKDNGSVVLNKSYQSKPITTRKQTNKKFYNEMTSRQIYDQQLINKKQSSNMYIIEQNNVQRIQSKQRSPQLIKLMINELQKQLQEKQTPKNSMQMSTKVKKVKENHRNYQNDKYQQSKQNTCNIFRRQQKELKQFQSAKSTNLNNKKSLKNYNTDANMNSTNVTTKLNWHQNNDHITDNNFKHKSPENKCKKKNVENTSKFSKNNKFLSIDNSKSKKQLTLNLNNNEILNEKNNFGSPKSTIKKYKQQKHSIQSIKRDGIKLNNTKKKIKKESQKSKQNFIFFGNDLIQLNNLNIPLFILQNSSDLYRSKKHPTSRHQKTIQAEQKNSFLRHSKDPSFDCINTERSRQVKHIQRSFLQEDSQVVDVDTTTFQTEKQFQFLIKNMTVSQNQPTFEVIQQQLKHQQNNSNYNNGISKNIVQISIDSNKKKNNFSSELQKIILINQSICKLQKWWKNVLQERKIKSKIVENKKILQSEVESLKKQETQKVQQVKHIQQTQKKLQKINQTKVQSQKLNDEIVSVKVSLPQHEAQITSQNQKNIFPTSNFNEHQDILKLRQNASNLQFNAHLQILKQFLSKNKISRAQYDEKVEFIQNNLNKELHEIKEIKSILKESAKKVQSIMKKTKEDIQFVKKINDQAINQQNHQDQNKDQQQHHIILNTLFKPCSKVHDDIYPKQQKLKQKEKFQKRCKRLKASSYQKDVDDYLNQNSQQSSFNSSTNGRKMFNSPNSGSQQDLCSPCSKTSSEQNKEREQFSSGSQEQIIDEEMIFTHGIRQSQCGTSSNPAEIPIQAMQNCNFQQLYKQYQQQQQIKKQVQVRIAKQLGLQCPEDIQNQMMLSQVGINTSIVGIHKFLINFFKFYLYYHKSQFLKNMNMPYGQSIQVRLKKNKLPQLEARKALNTWQKQTMYTQDDQQVIYGLRNVIQSQVLQEFFQSYYQQTDIQFNQAQKTNIQLQKIHNKAVFQAFNQSLNMFRPYYIVNGPPYLWCSSQKSLTFYFIGSDNIQQVYDKTQTKILKMASYLCGTNVNMTHKNVVKYENKSEKSLEQEQKQKQIQKQESSQIITSPFVLLQSFSQQSPAEKVQQVQTLPSKSFTFQTFLQSYTQNFNPAFFSILQQRLKKKQTFQFQQQTSQFYTNTFEQQKVQTLLKLTEIIEQIILLEESSILMNYLNNSNPQKQNLNKSQQNEKQLKTIEFCEDDQDFDYI